MVVEHVADPRAFAEALARLIRPGGRVIVFTVNRWSPIALLAALLPFRMHYPIKRWFWGGQSEDTFPVHYRINTRRALRAHFDTAGFDEEAFIRADDLSTFGQFKTLNYGELLLWRGLRRLGVSYPEHCLVGLYRRRA